MSFLSIAFIMLLTQLIEGVNWCARAAMIWAAIISMNFELIGPIPALGNSIVFPA